MSTTIYLSGDWYNPPIELAKELESNGFDIPLKWWEEKHKVWAKPEFFVGNVKNVDIYVLSLTSNDRPSAGCYLGAGVALSEGKPVYVLCENGTKPATALLNPHIVTDRSQLFELLISHKRSSS